MTRNRRYGLLAIAAVIVLGAAAFAIASSGGGRKHFTGVAQIGVKNGKPVGGIRTISASKGDSIRFVVNSDVADEVHVHGYNFHKDVKPGAPVSFDFRATIDGTFVIELEHRSEQIASLEVQP